MTLANPSLVSVCNQALSWLGAQRISDLEEDSTRAVACKDRLGDTVREVLRQHPWTCCIKRARITADTDGPEFGGGNKFTLPAGFERVVEVVPRDAPYRKESGCLVVDEDVIGLVYISNAVPVEQWASPLRPAEAAKLAMNIAPQLGMSVGGEVAANWESALRAARHASGSERLREEVPDEDWLGARDSYDDPRTRGVNRAPEALGGFGDVSSGGV